MKWWKTMKEWFSGLFSKRTREELREERLSEQIIEEDEERLREAYESEIPATVITYVFDEAAESEMSTPRMEVLVEDFSARMLPETGAILWIDIDGQLRSFKMTRLDYICNSSEYDSMRVYIVVEPAKNSDIIPHPFYSINE